MLFTIVCHDKPDHLALRQRTRPDHIAYLGPFAAGMLVAGPMLDPEGQPCGSLFVMDFPDRDAALAFAAADPYAQAGLFGRTEIHAYRAVFKDGVAV